MVVYVVELLMGGEKEIFGLYPRILSHSFFFLLMFTNYIKMISHSGSVQGAKEDTKRKQIPGFKELTA